ncbi:MAG TPA: hypothetical protein VFP68_19710 [Burkholderiaceae bacterium]|nr:hypothetical protein [Burkholderiaceae bacterium]
MVGTAAHQQTSHRWLAMFALAFLVGGATAQSHENAGGISVYSCITADGRRLTSDRYIAECSGREQRVLNKDGSLRRLVPPVMSAEERAEHEARERRQEAERAAQKDAIRRDRNLVNRYPDEAAHQRAREAALDSVRAAVKTSEQRMKDLTTERKPLLDEAEFYKGKQMPAKLKQQLEANQAAADAQGDVIATQQAEMERINRLYDAELARLKKLWAGAPYGSLTADIAASSPARR